VSDLISIRHGRHGRAPPLSASSCRATHQHHHLTSSEVVISSFAYPSDPKIESPQWLFYSNLFPSFYSDLRQLFFNLSGALQNQKQQSAQLVRASDSKRQVLCSIPGPAILFTFFFCSRSIHGPWPRPTGASIAHLAQAPIAARSGPAHTRQPSSRPPGSRPPHRSSPNSFSAFSYILQICLFYIFQTITPNIKCYI
jgi:hypothetical protein